MKFIRLSIAIVFGQLAEVYSGSAQRARDCCVGGGQRRMCVSFINSGNEPSQPMRSLLSASFLLLVPVLFITAISLHAQQTVPFEGTVIDAESGASISGAVIRAVEMNRRTYTSSKGTFRLPVTPGQHRIVASSIGYLDTTFTIQTGGAPLTIRLHASSIPLQGVQVTAPLDADQIIRRAIDRKDENRRKAKTVQGLLYSKISLTIDGEAFGRINEEDRQSIIETFSRAYYSERGPRLEVIQRRQTANVPAESNLLAIGDFISFYDDELPVFSTRIPSPLNASTLGRYEFSVRERTSINGQTVYVIAVKPVTTVLPAFEGTIKIVADTYNLIEVDLRPSSTTAVAFVQNLSFKQRFEKFQDDIWQPTYLEVAGTAKVEIVRGIAEVQGKLLATSIFTELKVNEPIPDSVYQEERIIVAAPDADSVRKEFWEGNALSELSESEKEIYSQVDSLVAASDTTQPSGGSFSVLPYLDFNRVASATVGAEVNLRLGPARLDLTGAYSFGMKEWLGTAATSINVLNGEEGSLNLRGSLFSWINSTTSDRTIPRIINTAVVALFHRDYYDYFRNDGWNAGLQFDINAADINGTLQTTQSRHFNLVNTVAHSIFRSKEFRPNPSVLEATFRTLEGGLSWGTTDQSIVISSNPSGNIGARVDALYGEHEGSGLSFRSIEGGLNIALPTIPTGYSPMMLRIIAHGGAGSDNLPLQYQFRMRTSHAFLGRFGSFFSAPTAFYGGTRYVALSAEHNFTDILWRAVGLPTYEGRGLELSISAAAGKFENEALAGYVPTGDNWYTEAGFGIGRIPIFISNVIYLQFDARWGFGPLGKDKFGAVIGLTSPF